MIELTFLGTASGIPTKQRNVSALAIKPSRGKAWCLVDCGEGTQHQLLHCPLSLVQLQAIYITHMHGDHCFGLPGLLASASMAGRTEGLKIIGPHALEAFVTNALGLSDSRVNFPLAFYTVEALAERADTDSVDARFDTELFTVSCVPLSHRIPSYAYVFDLQKIAGKLDLDALENAGVPRGPLWGELARGNKVHTEDGRELLPQDFLLDSGKMPRVIIGGDNDTPMLLLDAARSADVVVHEATYTQEVSDKVGPWPQHSSALKVAEFAQAARLKNVILTHFSARYHHPDPTKKESIEVLRREAENAFTGRVFLADDLARYVLRGDGTVVVDTSF